MLRVWTLLAVLLATPALGAGGSIRHVAGEPFRIGLLAERGFDRGVAALDRLKHVYSQALGMPVEILVARDYPALIEAHVAGRVDYAVYSAMAYAVAWRMCGCVEPIAAPVSADDDTGLAAVLYLHGDSMPDTADTLVAQGATLVSSLYRAAHPGQHLTEQPAGQAEAAFVTGEAEAYLGWAPAGGARTERGGSMARFEAAGLDVTVGWQSDPVRFGPHTVRKDIAAATRSRLLDLLGGLHEADPVAYDAIERRLSGGFRPASHADYQPVIDLLPPEPSVALAGESAVEGLR